MEVDLQSLFGLHVTVCAQLYLLAEAQQLPPIIFKSIFLPFLRDEKFREVFLIEFVENSQNFVVTKNFRKFSF